MLVGPRRTHLKRMLGVVQVSVAVVALCGCFASDSTQFEQPTGGYFYNMDSGTVPSLSTPSTRQSHILAGKGWSDAGVQIQGKGDRKLKVKGCRPSLLISAIFLWLYYFLYIMSVPENKEDSVNHIVDMPTVAKYKIKRNISIQGDDFILDGKKLQILSGSFHYFRTPAAYWRDRLRKLRAAGLNAVSTYVEWSFHETEERQYNFEGDRDIVSFVNLAAEEGLFVLLRPGPYICAERDLGGFPYWLLGKYPNIRLRTLDPDFLSETNIWLEKLFEYMTPLLYAYGGPIILVQVENEYGSYFYKKFYMAAIRDMILKHAGPHALLYTTDGATSCNFKPGSVNGTLTTIDFGSDMNVEKAFSSLRKYMPHGPLMNSEFYLGWMTHWTEPFQRRPINTIIATLTQMLEKSIHINFYMFHGGTNFEFTAGANYFSKYQPDTTSYDYDAPLTEAGDPTEKYFVIRNLLKKYNSDVNKLEKPKPSPKGAYGEVLLPPKLDLLSPEGRAELGKIHPPSGEVLPTFEKLRQRAGLLLFESKVSVKVEPNKAIWLVITKPRDHVYVYIDGELQGFLSRMNQVYAMRLKISKTSIVLSLLVENLGRINYGSKLHDSKGILSPVYLDHKPLNCSWSVIGYPLETLAVSPHPYRGRFVLAGPVLYEGLITLPPGVQPLDTFLDTSGWRKGYIWINGYNLGRYWQVGPQKTLYVPGVWLKQAPAQNLIQVLELEDAPANLTVRFIDYPILDESVTDKINWHWPDRRRILSQHYKKAFAKQ